MASVFGNWKKKRALAKIQVGEHEWLAVEADLPFLDRLNSDERDRLRAMAREFLTGKEWDGAGGLRLTPTIQLAIALQACLLVLNLGLEHYRGWVGIIVYPGDFVIPRSIMDTDGIVHEYDDEVLGEAWDGGPVVLSWFDDAVDADGINMVIHEFAHKLDMENGVADGIPRLSAEMSRHDWIAAFEPAYQDFCRRVDAGEETLLDPYAAEHPAEFFAVMSEAFFVTPVILIRQYPGVYAQLRQFYRQDPAG
jgi:Mlc titration factor MtfA (ptsG expression regulator)